MFVFQDNLKSHWFLDSGSLSIAMLNSDHFRGFLPPSTSPRRLDTVALRRGSTCSLVFGHFFSVVSSEPNLLTLP